MAIPTNVSRGALSSARSSRYPTKMPSPMQNPQVAPSWSSWTGPAVCTGGGPSPMVSVPQPRDVASDEQYGAGREIAGEDDQRTSVSKRDRAAAAGDERRPEVHDDASPRMRVADQQQPVVQV